MRLEAPRRQPYSIHPPANSQSPGGPYTEVGGMEVGLLEAKDLSSSPPGQSGGERRRNGGLCSGKAGGSAPGRICGRQPWWFECG